MVAPCTLVIVSVWLYSGYMMIIFIAGLSNIPCELIEVATIDGATGFQRLRTIVLPLDGPRLYRYYLSDHPARLYGV